jgi:hypothetical protein
MSEQPFADWWHDLGSVALLGTARRPVPALPPLGLFSVALDPEARSEEALLSSAALGAAALRAGRRPERLTPGRRLPRMNGPPPGGSRSSSSSSS